MTEPSVWKEKSFVPPTLPISHSASTLTAADMKRKLDERDVPVPVETPEPSEETIHEDNPEESNKDTPVPPKSIESFKDFGLDPRLLQGIANASLSKPTEVQTRAIPLIIEGKDVLGQLHQVY